MGPPAPIRFRLKQSSSCAHLPDVVVPGLPPIAKAERVAGTRRFLRQPVSDDTVVDLVIGRDLDQLDHSLAPFPLGLYPDGRPLLVPDAVQVVIEVAVALDEAETFQVVVEVAGVKIRAGL